MSRVATRFQLEMKMGVGWSEIYYTLDTGSPKALVGKGQLLVNERVKSLVSSGSIHHVRISAVGDGSPSYRFPPVGGRGAVVDFQDVPLVTTNVGIYSAGGFRRTLQLHGLPDAAHNYDIAGIPNSVLRPSVDTFCTFLQTNGYCIKLVTERASAHAGEIISNIVTAGPLTTVNVDATGLVAGDKVRISGAVGYKARQWNGVFKILQTLTPITNGFTFNTRKLMDSSATYIGNSAQLREADIADYTYAPMTDHDAFESNGSRRTGRPTDLPRGKQSIKR